MHAAAIEACGNDPYAHYHRSLTLIKVMDYMGALERVDGSQGSDHIVYELSKDQINALREKWQAEDAKAGQ